MNKCLWSVLGCMVFVCAACDYREKNKDIISLKADGLYKIIPVQNFDQANLDSCVKPLPLDEQSGFIHTSYGSQASSVLDKFFKSAGKLVILELDADVLKKNGTHVQVEANKPGGTKYPHLYGVQKIPHAAVKKVIIIYETADSKWSEKG